MLVLFEDTPNANPQNGFCLSLLQIAVSVFHCQDVGRNLVGIINGEYPEAVDIFRIILVIDIADHAGIFPALDGGQVLKWSLELFIFEFK